MTILKGIPRILSPELLYVLSRCGHGDVICIADCNFPSVSVAAHTALGLVRADGHMIPPLLKAITSLFPLDSYADPIGLMAVAPSDVEKGLKPTVWEEYKAICNEAEGGRNVGVEMIERMEFYERANKAVAVIHTGETALYGNILLQKGVIDADGNTV